MGEPTWAGYKDFKEIIDAQSVPGQLEHVSVIQARKERERAAREELILDHAQRILLRDGFQNLNLDTLAKEVEYSKGTLYLHFKTKEDIALAVVTRAYKERAEFFERALVFKGRSRERAQAIAFACGHFAQVYPDYYNVEMMLKSVSFWEKADPARQHEYDMQTGRIFRVVHRVVSEGLQAGDIPAGKLPAEQIVFSIGSMAVGTQIMARNIHAASIAGIHNTFQGVCQNMSVVLDGLGWKPLSSEWDYKAVIARIKKEVFPDATWFKN